MLLINIKLPCSILILSLHPNINYTISFKLIDMVSHTTMMNSFFIVDPGLYQGQMGIAIAMAKLYGNTGNKVF